MKSLHKFKWGRFCFQQPYLEQHLSDKLLQHQESVRFVSLQQGKPRPWGRAFARWCSVKPAINCSLPITANLHGSEHRGFFANHQFTRQPDAKHKSRVCWHRCLSSSSKLLANRRGFAIHIAILSAGEAAVEANRREAGARAADKPFG